MTLQVVVGGGNFKTKQKNKTKMKKELVVSELNSVITKLEDAKKQMLDIQNGISFVDGNKEIEKYMSVFDA